ncbi:S-layer homology domain-containing protein [Paenibacillus plantiphilus]|nr:S-layer homology domain-containing protein [Paenibacillus plantiphilus]
MLKKQLAILLIVLLAGMPFLGAWPLRAEAAYTFSGGGDGNPGNPYVILTAEDLDNIRGSSLLSKHYKLGADIDLSPIANWVPIGTSSSPFGGNFDGGHYTISNLTIDSSADRVGLFGFAQSADAGSTTTTIKNMRLENVNITSRGSNANVGGLAGATEAWTTVDRVSVSGTITGKGYSAGGLTGISSNIVSNSDAHVHINGDFGQAGGLTGANGSSVTQSYATGDVKVTGNQNKAGGLVGFKWAGGISNSYATGRIEASHPDSSVGGLIGYYGDTITNSYASGTLIKAPGTGHIGGLIGDSGSIFSYTINNSYWNATDNPGLTTLGTKPGAGGALQKSDMKDMITLGGWSSTIWGIEEGLSTPYLKTFSPVLRVEPISTTYNTEPAGNVLQVSGHVRDGSIGEPLKISIVIQNDTDAIVTDHVYEMPATGDKETFDWQTTIDDQRYPEGTYTLSITAEDTVAGHAQQQTFLFDVQDTTAPSVPIITSPTAGQALGLSMPVISGTADTGSTVAIVLDGSAAGMATTGASGDWTWVPSSALSEGAHTVQARATDAAGNSSAASAARAFTVDTIAPTAAVSSAGGAAVNAPFPVTIVFSEVVQGFTENDIEIENGTVSNVATVTSTTYSATVSPATSGQAVKVTVAAGAVTDAVGNANPQSNTLLVQYDTTKPVAAFGNFTHGQLFHIPPATVTVSVYEAVYWIVGGAQINAGNALPLISMEKDGAAFTDYTASFDPLAHEFTLSLNGTVEDGEYEVVVAGNVVRNVYHNNLDAARASFIIDGTPPVAPVFLTPANGLAANTSTPTISGTAEAGTIVTIRLDGNAAATVTAAGNGSWSWTPSAVLTEGAHTVSVSATDAAGNTGSFSVEYSFTVDTQPPVIALAGAASIVLTAGDPFVDAGATAADSLEGNLPVTTTGNVDNQVPGTYTLQYDAQDSAGNAAVPVTRTIQVKARSAGSGSVQLSSNSNLKQLVVKAGGDELKLSPIFAAETTSYRVETSAAEISIEAASSDGKATLTLGEATLVGGKTVALTEGDNVFELIVKAENGTVKTYSLTIHRQTERVPSQGEGPACTFRDIKGHWAEQHICEAAGKGIVNGTSETEFTPQGLVTRVEFAAMLLRTLGVTPGAAADKLSFTDQDEIPAWATTTVSDAVEIGILQGYPDGSLRPLQTVNRSEMAAMMVRVMKWNIEQGQITSFADDADIPNWAKGYVYAAAERGLLNGREGNQFSPSQPATRAEAATILLRLWHALDEMPGKSRE